MGSLTELYERDFYTWLLRNAEYLKQGRPHKIDVENVAEELESLARQERRLLRDRLATLLQSLLQWQSQPGHRCDAWRAQIELQRMEIEDVLRYSPSLRDELKALLVDAYKSGRLMALSETGLAEDTFPGLCPYTLEDVMAPDFWPGSSSDIE